MFAFAQAALKTGEQAYLAQCEQCGFDEWFILNILFINQRSSMNKLLNNIQLADSGYGQGQVEMSILHTAIAYTPFVNEGNLIAPVLIKNGENELSTVWKEAVIDKGTTSLIKRLIRILSSS